MKRPRVKKPVASRPRKGRIHPVVIFPYRHPADLKNLEHLYGLVTRLDEDKDTYARPLTVIDCKTRRAMAKSAKHVRFATKTVSACSDVIDAWCVDTCQMWYTGLGEAFQRGRRGDTYWLIPGDFNYGSKLGQEVLGHLHDLPEICDELDQDVCIGEVHTDHTHSKQLIDDYGTFALMYNWFPAEAQAIRECTERPRSEFFAVRHGFLDELLHRRWFAYEQTVVMLLEAMFDHRSVSRYFVGNITDLPEGRDSLSSAVQQVERTDRVLKTMWKERHQSKSGWNKDYRVLEAQSDQIRRAAMVVLENLL